MNFKKLMATNPTFRRIVNEEAKRFAKIIKQYDSGKQLSEDKTTFPLVRGILNMIFDDARFINAADVRKMVQTFINSDSDDKEALRIALFAYDDENPTKIYDLHKQVTKELMPKNPSETEFKIHDTNPRDTSAGDASKNRDWRGGMWTGD
jgi:hypothetical protein